MSAMKRANPSITNEDSSFALIKKLDFDHVEAVVQALFYAFGDEESADDVDPREIALFTLFLASVGWTEDEFWQASEEAGEMCPDCEKEKEKEKEKEQEEVLPVIAKKPDTSKAN